MEKADPLSLHASVITLGELRLGIEDLPIGKRRSDLDLWFNTGLPNWFSSNLLPITETIVYDWARLTIEAKRKGITVSMADGLIAATALDHGLTLITRNVKDFAPLNVQVINPWDM